MTFSKRLHDVLCRSRSAHEHCIDWARPYGFQYEAVIGDALSAFLALRSQAVPKECWKREVLRYACAPVDFADTVCDSLGSIATADALLDTMATWPEQLTHMTSLHGSWPWHCTWMS